MISINYVKDRLQDHSPGQLSLSNSSPPCGYKNLIGFRPSIAPLPPLINLATRPTTIEPTHVNIISHGSQPVQGPIGRCHWPAMEVSTPNAQPVPSQQNTCPHRDLFAAHLSSSTSPPTRFVVLSGSGLASREEPVASETPPPQFTSLFHHKFPNDAFYWAVSHHTIAVHVVLNLHHARTHHIARGVFLSNVHRQQCLFLHGRSFPLDAFIARALFFLHYDLVLSTCEFGLT